MFCLICYHLDLYIIKQNPSFYNNIKTQMGCECCASLRRCFVADSPPPEDLLSKDIPIQTAIIEDSFIHFGFTELKGFVFQQHKNNGFIREEDRQLKFPIFKNSDRYHEYKQRLKKAVEGNNSSMINLLMALYKKHQQIPLTIASNSRIEIDESQICAEVPEQYPIITMEAIKYFIFLFTAESIYPKLFGNRIRQRQYGRVCQVIAVLKPFLRQFNNEQQVDRYIKANPQTGRVNNLWCSIKQRDSMYKTMARGQKLFFGGFVNTYTSQQVAENYGQYQYVIELRRQTLNKYLVLRPPYSPPGETRVILFPFFRFECQQKSFKKIKVIQILPEVSSPSKPKKTK